MWIAIFTFFLFTGYFVYGTTLEKNWKIDIFRDSSDWQEDESIISHFGFRYLQIAQFAVFLSFEALLLTTSQAEHNRSSASDWASDWLFPPSG